MIPFRKWYISLNKIIMRLLICMLVFITGNCFAQFRNNVWCFGDSAGINFQQGISSPTTFKTSCQSRGSSCSISDSAGNLIFYACSNPASNYPISGKVFNKTHLLMQGGDSIIAQAWFHQFIILPYPDSANIYFLFSTGITNYNGLFYSTIDLNQNGGLGKVVNKNISVLNIDIIDEIIAIKHGNGRDWWLITHDWNGNNNFIEYLVSSDSIHGPFYQSIGSTVNTDATRIKLSGDGNKLLLVDYLGLIELFDFNRCTGLINNSVTIHTENLSNTNANYFSCSFSPNNRFIYTNNSIVDTLGIVQYDITTANISSTKKKIYQGNIPVVGGAMETAPDGKIYLSCYAKCYTSQCFPYEDTLYNIYNTNLSVINYPDSPGVACNFTPFSFYLGGSRTYYGLPNNPDYDMPALAGSVCDSLTGIQNHFQISTYINVFPEPANDKITFEMIDGFFKPSTLFIYDITGRCVSEYILKENEHAKTIDLANLNSGMYFYRITNGHTFIFSDKFVVIKE